MQVGRGGAGVGVGGDALFQAGMGFFPSSGSATRLWSPILQLCIWPAYDGTQNRERAPRLLWAQLGSSWCALLPSPTLLRPQVAAREAGKCSQVLCSANTRKLKVGSGQRAKACRGSKFWIRVFAMKEGAFLFARKDLPIPV